MKLDSKNYVKQAENVIQGLNTTDQRGRPMKPITSSQIRNLLTLVNELYNMIRFEKSDTLSDEVVSHTQYVKMKIAYNAGRESNVKEFVQKSKIMEYLDGAGNSKADLLLVCHYMEALVAYHKYNFKD